MQGEEPLTPSPSRTSGGGGAAAFTTAETEDTENAGSPPPPPPPPPSSSSRELCLRGCGRPRRACLCLHLPPSPLPTSTAVVVLQHPHELRCRLSTSPLLHRCLLNCHLIPGRRLLPGSHPLLDSLHHLHTTAGGRKQPPDALFLFPATVAEESSDAVAHDGDLPRYRGRCRVLIVFDGTWKHAGEMVRASLPFMSCFARRVSLAGGRDRSAEGESMFESELALRKEPSRGCLTTMEAVARALRVLEPDEGRGADVETVLLSVLRAMVGVQRAHLAGKTVRPRPRLLKKGVKGKAVMEAPEEVEEKGITAVT